jgi:hypothetical protein
MAKAIDYERLLDKYMFHVSRMTGGNDFIGSSDSVLSMLPGLSREEMDALWTAAKAVRHDADLDHEMTLRRSDDIG